MPSKRILLMYISKVSGHRSAAAAIEKALRLTDPGVEILSLNAFHYTNPIAEKVVNRLYMGVIKRFPCLWDYLYDNDGVAGNVTWMQDLFYRMNSRKLRKLFDSFRPDVIVCSQAFPCGMTADYKLRYGYDVPLVAVLTDFVPHLYWVHDGIDFYITPSSEVDSRLCARGVPAAKIRQFGIPFDPKFSLPVDRQSVLSRYGLNPGGKNILVMGGGQGLGPIESAVISLDRALGSDFQIIAVTGTNRKLFHRLQALKASLKHKTSVFGFVDNVNELMSVCDLVVSKPGGITTSEALSMGLPMAIIKPIPGQEASNTDYLLKEKAAIRISDADSAGECINAVVSSRERLKELSVNARRIGKPSASMDTAAFLLGICGKRISPELRGGRKAEGCS